MEELTPSNVGFDTLCVQIITRVCRNVFKYVLVRVLRYSHLRAMIMFDGAFILHLAHI